MKKILVVAIAVAMLAVMAISAFAAESETVINPGWWDDWSASHEIADGATLKFDIDLVAGGTNVWNSVNAVFINCLTDGVEAPHTAEGYVEYAVLRTDPHGWATEYDKGNCAHTGDNINDLGITDYAAFWAGADYDITITREGNKVVYEYAILAADGTEVVSGWEMNAEDLSAGCYVFFTGDTGTEMTITVVDEHDGVNAPEGGNEGDAPQTGFATIALAIVAIGSGAYIVSKKH